MNDFSDLRELMQQARESGVITEVAKAHFEFYTALQEAGFTSTAALQIVIHNGSGLAVNK